MDFAHFISVMAVLSAIIIGCFKVIELCKDAPSRNIPASYWNNQELYTKDVLDGVSHEQRMKNLKNGKYYLPDSPEEVKSKPTEPNLNSMRKPRI